MKRVLAGVLAFLTGCSGADVEEYANNTPTMDIREFFNGDIEAHGVFFNWKGSADVLFTIAMKGKWQGNNGTLEEHFTYSSGRSDSRVWTIAFSDDHHFTGTARDIVGEASGKQFGNAVHFEYVMRVPSGDNTYDLSMDDWMYRADEHTVMNRITVHKFGLKVGEILVTFNKK